MHGYFKMLTEGYRTRDAHLLEWFARLIPDDERVAVVSRPEPFPRMTARLRSRRTEEPLPRTIDFSREVLAIPNLRDRRRWWIEALPYYRVPDSFQGSTVVWNPTIALSDPLVHALERSHHVHVDLLDDWSLHTAFESMWPDIERAYGRLFSIARTVSANSEGTLRLARRFGRDDVALLPNGADPERFSTRSHASGPPTVGYIGKIGSRLDADLIVKTARALPDVQFWFAGPLLEKAFGRALRGLPNVRLLGDVPYRRIPDLLTRFDIGWVPHGVETGQVGGDAIKIYEYRSAGLPVLTTPIIGTRERPMPGVIVRDADEHAVSLAALIGDSARVPRLTHPLDPDLTWQRKARTILRMMGVPGGPA
jgi:glycosyltransferase involved in cell wall biosynthesis